MEDFAHYQTEDSTLESDWVSTPIVIRTDKNLVVKDQFQVNDQEVQMLRGQRIAHGTTGTNYTLAATDFLIGVTSLAAAPSLGLPKPSTASVGKNYIIKDEVGGAATTTITIKSDGEKLIDGATSITITSNYGSRTVYSDGANWFTI